MSTKVCVVGSINMDLVVGASKFPMPGETLLGGPFSTFPGGKGANQAVAAARMGAEVSMVGCVGRPYGSELLEALAANEIDVRGVRAREDISSGVGVITVVPSGENAIVVASGANARLTPADVDRHADLVEAADALVLQLEVPEDANERAVEVARRTCTATILNAAPARPVRPEVLRSLDLVIVNRVEAAMLTGLGTDAPVMDLLAALVGLGVAEAVVTLGERGAVWSDGDEVVRREAYRVEAVDTTACGDAFVGVFAVARGDRLPTEECLRLACAAGAIAARTAGAFPSLPGRDVVERLARTG
jgi:ribokinase